MIKPSPIVVLGAGSWGTALAIQLCRAGGTVTLWGHEPELMADIDAACCNERYLPGVPLPEQLSLNADLVSAMVDVQDVLVVVPSHAFRAVLTQLRPLLKNNARLAWATKGLESGSGKLLHEVAEEVLGNDIATAVVSGPTFASEVAEGLPTAVTVASTDALFATDMAARLHSKTFRAYTNDDVVGVEVGGAVKNVLAIAAGIADGLGYGANARTALITRGLAEMMRLGEAMGGRRETFMGLAGMGDLILTCTDNQSRNRRTGLLLAQGKTLEQVHTEIGQAIEGIKTAKEVVALARRYDVEVPISEQVYRVLYEGCPIDEAVRTLLSRKSSQETI